MTRSFILAVGSALKGTDSYNARLANGKGVYIVFWLLHLLLRLRL